MGNTSQPEVPRWQLSGGKVSDADQPVAHTQAPVTMGSTAICNPADIDVSVPGGAGGVHTPADAEPQTLVSSKKLHLHKAPICLLNMSPLHCQMHNVSCPLEDFSCEAVSGFCDTDIVDMGYDVTYPQGPLQVCRSPGGDVGNDHWLSVKEEVAAKDCKSKPIGSFL